LHRVLFPEERDQLVEAGEENTVRIEKAKGK
jgi:hypothetical protein